MLNGVSGGLKIVLARAKIIISCGFPVDAMQGVLKSRLQILIPEHTFGSTDQAFGVIIRYMA